MDYNLADASMGMDPMQRQMLQAQILRRTQQQQALQAANEQAHQHDMLAAVSQMANNPGAAAAAKMAATQSQGQFKPLSLGQTGFALPSTGEFVSSPMYEDEKQNQRLLRRSLADQTDATRRQAQQDRSDAQIAADERAREALAQRASEGEANRLLRLSLAQLAENGRNSRADEKVAKGKTLNPSELRKFSEQEGVASTFADLAAGFKPEFAGTPGMSGMQNTLGRYQPFGIGKGYEEQANWWQNYNDQKNVIRNKLFGTALTAPEKAAFDAANISEGMDPKVIQTRLAQQHAAAIRAHNKLKGTYSKGGYDMSAFEDLPEPKAVLPGGSPRVPAMTPNTLKLPPGFKIIGEAP